MFKKKFGNKDSKSDKKFSKSSVGPSEDEYDSMISKASSSKSKKKSMFKKK